MWVRCVWVSWGDCVVCEELVCGRRREAEEAEAVGANGSTEPKTRTLHKDVGKNIIKLFRSFFDNG